MAVPGRSTVCDGSSTVTSVSATRNCAWVRVPVGWTRSFTTRIGACAGFGETPPVA